MTHEVLSVAFGAASVNYVCSEFLAQGVFAHWVTSRIVAKHISGAYRIIFLNRPVRYWEEEVFGFRCAFSFEVPFEQLNGFWTKECAEFYACFVAAFTGEVQADRAGFSFEFVFDAAEYDALFITDA